MSRLTWNGDPRENTRALQRLVDQPGRTLVRFEAGQYEFAGEVRVPAPADTLRVPAGGIVPTGYVAIAVRV